MADSLHGQGYETGIVLTCVCTKGGDG